MLIIGICGGSGSGKTRLVNQVISDLPHGSVSVLPQDAYYKDNGNLSAKEKRMINFDHPDSVDFRLLVKHLDLLRKDLAIEMPSYSYVECTRLNGTTRVVPGKVIILEGILILSDPGVRKRLDVTVFIDASADDRLTRIIRRDTVERGRSYQDVLRHYEKFVKPMHLEYIEPAKKYADIIIPGAGTNIVAARLLTSLIKHYL